MRRMSKKSKESRSTQPRFRTNQGIRVGSRDMTQSRDGADQKDVERAKNDIGNARVADIEKFYGSHQIWDYRVC